jgi:hypothetical protein
MNSESGRYPGKTKVQSSSRFFASGFFMNQFPPSPRVFHLDRFEFFRKFTEIFASQCAPLVSTTPVANFPTIFASVVDTGGKFAAGVNDTGCRHLKVSLKAKIYIYVKSTTQRCPNKIIKIFLLEGFFHLPPVSLTPVANLELRISPRIFEKIRNGRNGIIRGLGETDS